MGRPLHRHARAACLVAACLIGSAPSPAAQTEPQRFQAGVQLTAIASGEFDDTDLGIGGRVSWHPNGVLGVETEIGLFPGDFARRPAFSRSRVEALFGITAGPRIGRLRPFARVRPGFVRFDEAPAPFACILIFPPPLPCVLAGGATVAAIDLGGGAEWTARERTFVRVDLGDRLMRYPGPAFTSDRTARQGSFAGHDLRVTIGAGLAF
jgi:hypothetical protein